MSASFSVRRSSLRVVAAVSAMTALVGLIGLLGGLAAAPGEAAASATTVTLVAVADARVSQAAPAQNYGSDPQLVVGHSNTNGLDLSLVRFDLSGLPSDAVNTTQDDSDATFSVPGSAPRAIIHSPQDGSAHPVTRPLILEGAGSDLEDGTLRGSALVWRSDRDGFLGTGPDLRLPPGRLSFGWHRIILTATDRDGMTAAATVEVFIEPLRLYLPVLYR